jgi:hypothetical protein
MFVIFCVLYATSISVLSIIIRGDIFSNVSTFKI